MDGHQNRNGRRRRPPRLDLGHRQHRQLNNTQAIDEARDFDDERSDGNKENVPPTIEPAELRDTTRGGNDNRRRSGNTVTVPDRDDTHLWDQFGALSLNAPEQPQRSNTHARQNQPYQRPLSRMGEDDPFPYGRRQPRPLHRGGRRLPEVDWQIWQDEDVDEWTDAEEDGWLVASPVSVQSDGWESTLSEAEENEHGSQTRAAEAAFRPSPPAEDGGEVIGWRARPRRQRGSRGLRGRAGENDSHVLVTLGRH